MCCVRRLRRTLLFNAPAATGLTLSGEGAGKSTRRRVRSPDFCYRVLRSLGLLSFLTVSTWFLLPRRPLLDGVSFSQCVRDRNGTLLRITLTNDQKFRVHTPLREISPELIAATLRFEDQHYERHPGVNPLALIRAGLSAMRYGHATSGASTITMQVARLRFHLHTRTIRGKLTQILRALELERHYSKTEILDAYLNLAPYGRNIEGAGAASEMLFAKPASRLTRPEAIALSVIPQSPSRRALSNASDNRSLNLAQNRWYDRAGEMTGTGLTGRSFSARSRGNCGSFASHFVRQVLLRNPNESQIATTLDLSKQQMIERRASDYVALNHSRGVNNAAVLLVDTRTMDVLAQIGSADFWNEEIDGQVDGTRALRSPGSTLKPFVYALAIDQGLIHPLSILADAPQSFGDYNPENFDRRISRANSCQRCACAQPQYTRGRARSRSYRIRRSINFCGGQRCLCRAMNPCTDWRCRSAARKFRCKTSCAYMRRWRIMENYVRCDGLSISRKHKVIESLARKRHS